MRMFKWFLVSRLKMIISAVGLNKFLFTKCVQISLIWLFRGNDSHENSNSESVLPYYVLPFWVVHVSGHSWWPLKHGIVSYIFCQNWDIICIECLCKNAYNLFQTRMLCINNVKWQMIKLPFIFWNNFNINMEDEESSDHKADDQLFHQETLWRTPQEVRFAVQSYFLTSLPLHC